MNGYVLKDANPVHGKTCVCLVDDKYSGYMSNICGLKTENGK